MSCIVYNGPGPNGNPIILPSTFALPKQDEVSHHEFLLPQHPHVHIISELFQLANGEVLLALEGVLSCPKLYENYFSWLMVK